MTFVVEDGTGVADANSFVSLADANSYFDDRPSEKWSSATDDEKEKALIKSSEWLSTQKMWLSYRVKDDQSLAWPRSSHSGVPKQVETAALMIAAEILNGVPLYKTKTDSKVIQSVKAGSVSVTYADQHSSRTIESDLFPWLDNLLNGLVHSPSNTFEIVRA